ncbi:MAG: hypothetical protein M3Y87_27140 [Myxococcota bacterium]|nr:hypothetical protein [Myxococcota bacterium]
MSRWSTTITPCGARAETWRIEDATGHVLRVCDALELLRDDAELRTFMTTALAGSRWAAFFWETPPVTRATLDRALEMTLTDAPALAKITADRSAFADRLDAAGTDDVIAFPNLAGDAMLVVPSAVSRADAYAHLGAFVRRAPPAQTDHFWSKAAEAALARVSDAPMWISTAGMGVPWLHLRLDSTPKYYRHLPYKHGA